MRKKILIIALIIVVVAMLAGLGACTSLKNNIKIEDNVVSRFGDGIAILKTDSAPKTAVEYKSTPRVTAKVNVDARMSGYHITGLYLPAGESLTITVPNTVRLNYYTIYVDTYAADRRVSRSISRNITELTSPTGGIVEIFVPASDESTSETVNASFNMTIEGGIVIPYYRLGRDPLEQIERGDGAYAVLDCVNARFYVPTSALYDEEKKSKIDDIYNVLLWWKSAVSFINETLGIASSSRDYTSSIVFGDYSTIAYDPTVRVTYAPISYFEKTLMYSSLVNGEAWDLMYNICDYKTKVADGDLSGIISRESLVNVLCAVDHVVMTNPSEDDEIIDDTNWLHDSYSCLKATLEILQLPTAEIEENYHDEMMMAFFINILHSFGLDKTIEIISEYRKEPDPLDTDDFALLISSILRADMSLYFDTFQMKISQETKNKMSGNQLYVPVQTKFTVGSENNTYSHGYTVPMGERVVFDFESNIVSIVDGWEVEKIVGNHSNLWSRDSENKGIYYYDPSQDALIDEYYVTLSNGDYTVTLYGKINVVITVATYKVYEGWKFDKPTTALSEAIGAYEKRTPDYIGSIDFAGVQRRDEVDNNTYVLTVTSGCIRVPESGKYRFYLRNNGRCKVEFGVPKYMFDMFDISIPFSEFTRGHSYDIDLDAGTNYYFNLFLLSTKGGCDAALGIRYIEDDDASDAEDSVIVADIVDSKYLYYNGLSDDKVVKFEPPVIYPTGYGFKDEFYQPYDLTEDNVVSYPRAFNTSSEIEFAFDELNSSYYTARSRETNHEIILNLDGEKRLEYVQFFVRSVSSMVGANVKFTVADNAGFAESRELHLADSEIKAGLNTFMFDAVKDKYLKITFYAEEAFECSFTDLKMGQHFDASQIVPNTSSSIAYMGGWLDNGEYVCVNGSISQSVNQNSVMSFTALSRQICIYGVKDSNYGKMEVYVDGSKVAVVDLYSETTMTDQLLYAIDFDLWAEHTVKVMPASDDDIINIDYISYLAIEKEEIREYSGFLYAVFILPAVIIVALAGAAIADFREKRKRNKSKVAPTEEK
ncbi:MAG: hypothetical protein K2I23_06915 [Clostridia bacterium]|nr:hypothetical protein [Clostridia bacterium]